MVVEKSEDWKKYKHEILDVYLNDFNAQAHKKLDKILELETITNDSFCIGPLAQTVMILMGDKSYKPTSKQKLWAGEIAMLKKMLR